MIDELPPHHLETEKAVLGCMLLDQRAGAFAASYLEPEDFYSTGHEKTFRVIADLLASDKPTDPVTVGEQLESRGWLEEAGGAMALFEIIQSVPHTEHVKYYCQTARGYGDKRRLLAACREGIQQVRNGGIVGDIVEQVTRSVRSAASYTARTLEEIRASMQDEAEQPQSTGLDAIDEAIGGGVLPGDLIVVAARPSMGKTAMGVQLAIAGAQQEAGLFVSIEMRAEKVAARLSDEEIPADRLLIEDQVSEIGDVCASIRRAYQQHRITIAVVDYLQRVRVAGRLKSFEEIEKVTAQCKRLARDLQIPVVLLAQLSRKVEERDDKTPRLSDLKGAGAIEEDADQVLLLHRPSYYVSTDRPGEADVIVAKNRDGARGQTVTLGFEADRTRFVPWEKKGAVADEYFTGESS